MTEWRKKSVVVEAEQYRLGLEDGFCVPPHLMPYGATNPTFVAYIDTLEGRHWISEGDYIITGVRGERYPCKPDIFFETYEFAEEPTKQPERLIARHEDVKAKVRGLQGTSCSEAHKETMVGQLIDHDAAQRIEIARLERSRASLERITGPDSPAIRLQLGMGIEELERLGSPYCRQRLQAIQAYLTREQGERDLQASESTDNLLFDAPEQPAWKPSKGDNIAYGGTRMCEKCQGIIGVDQPVCHLCGFQQVCVLYPPEQGEQEDIEPWRRKLLSDVESKRGAERRDQRMAELEPEQPAERLKDLLVAWADAEPDEIVLYIPDGMTGAVTRAQLLRDIEDGKEYAWCLATSMGQITEELSHAKPETPPHEQPAGEVELFNELRDTTNKLKEMTSKGERLCQGYASLFMGIEDVLREHREWVNTSPPVFCEQAEESLADDGPATPEEVLCSYYDCALDPTGRTSYHY